jgi:hypothetical protein
MKLIREEVTDVHFLTERDEKTGKKHLYIEGVFMQAELKNRNGRVYPKAVLDREADRYNRDYVQRNRAYGELGHPDNPTINLDRVSHMITKLYPDGNNYIGKAKILDTPKGKIVKSLLESGGNLGVSTRGVGSLREGNGCQLVQDDFHLATAADIVADPSAPDAFVQGIMEDAEWILTAKGWKPVMHEQAKKVLKEASRQDIEDTALRIFENFMKSISKS